MVSAPASGPGTGAVVSSPAPIPQGPGVSGGGGGTTHSAPPGPTMDGGHSPSGFGGGQSVHDETPQTVSHDVDSPSVQAGMSQPQNQVRRFSKDNPKNFEVFQRSASQVERFDKPSEQGDSIPKMDPPK